ncbi:MAG TPA: carbonic anhydrase family protein [Steroidobacteraceae bacterium]|jgi:carbonic anhydrase
MSTKFACCPFPALPAPTRRQLLKSAAGLAALGALGATSLILSPAVSAAALTQEQRDRLTPDQILELLERGNERFRTGKMQAHDFLAQKRATVAAQHPALVLVSCIDSRAPAEIIFDVALGDMFNARVAGNVANDDLLGSLEFACAAAGAKVVLVMGHTSCGAIKGAIDNVQLGHLTGLLAKIKPAVSATSYAGEHTSKNAEFVDAVAKTNVHLTVEAIRSQSEVLAKLEAAGKIKIAGSMYHLSGGRVEFLS